MKELGVKKNLEQIEKKSSIRPIFYDSNGDENFFLDKKESFRVGKLRKRVKKSVFSEKNFLMLDFSGEKNQGSRLFVGKRRRGAV